MSYIIGNKCTEVCDMECVSVCPADAIHGPVHTDKKGAELEYLKSTGELKALTNPQMYINPATCISCNKCLPVCPVDAIYSSENEAIIEGETEAVLKNYIFYGMKYIS